MNTGKNRILSVLAFTTLYRSPYLRLFILILICLFWQVKQVLLYSQPVSYINGKVINSTTSGPVPFATIKLKSNQLGVYANAEGDFKLICNPEFQADSIIVTCIGFKRYSFAFKDLNNITVNKIYLTPVLYGLAEVKVSASRKKLGSVTIIRRAIRNIGINYPHKPYTFISYYRDYQKRERNYLNLNEAIVQTIDNGFSLKSTLNKYRLLDFRKNTDFPRMNISPFYDIFDTPDLISSDKIIPNAVLGDQYGNELFILMVHDALRNYEARSFSFIDNFSEDFIMNHNFSEPTQVLNNNLLLYKIIFNTRSRIIGDSMLVSGAIYIQPKDYSIHKLEYTCSYLIKGKGLKKMFNVDLEYGYENSVDSKMCLKYISFNNIFNVVDPDDNSYFRIVSSYWGSYDASGPTLILEFSNTIDPESVSGNKNYDIKIGGKKAKISNIRASGKMLFINIKNNDLKELRDSSLVNVRNLKDIDGNILNKQKVIELYQYRELFVQEYNRHISFTDSCFLQYLPLEQNCISKYTGKDKYWMNTPGNIKNDK